MSEDNFDAVSTPDAASDLLQIDVGALSSVTLARLVDEVRNDEPATLRSYDRTHNRHNR